MRKLAAFAAISFMVGMIWAPSISIAQPDRMLPAPLRHAEPEWLAGTYYAHYPVLFGETGNILNVEKFLTIESTQAPHLFLYAQCWRLVEGGGWNHEKGALVISSEPGSPLEFWIVEALNSPVEGSTGFFEGQMLSRDRLDIIYLGLDRAIVFRMDAGRTDIPVDSFSCPLE